MGSKSIWDICAPLYERAMKSQRHIYEYMYTHISEAVRGKAVLEIATGPGMIAKHIASSAGSVTATDFSPAMIAVAKKGGFPENVTFTVADAAALCFEDASFDAVVIANALHILPDAEKALLEIGRVLKKDGMLIAPNFIVRKSGRKNAWQKLLSLIGIQFSPEWTQAEYTAFLESHGWTVTKKDVIHGRIDLLYAECRRGID